MLITSSDLKKLFGKKVGDKIHDRLIKKSVPKKKKIRAIKRVRRKMGRVEIMDFYGSVTAWHKNDIILVLQNMVEKPRKNTSVSLYKECIDTLKNLKEVESDAKH